MVQVQCENRSLKSSLDISCFDLMIQSSVIIPRDLSFEERNLMEYSRHDFAYVIQGHIYAIRIVNKIDLIAVILNQI